MSNAKNSHLSKNEKEVLQKLESIIGRPIPLIKSCEYDKLGYSVRDNHVFGLCLAHQKLSIFPKCILRLELIQELWFLDNRIQYLPENIGDLKHLIRIDMENNFQLSNLPESVWNLEELQVLGLGGNKFSDISEKITELPNLKILFLENNKFTIIPEFVWDLTQLEIFSIGGNKIKEISSKLQNFTQLRFINLKNLDFLGSYSRSIGSQRKSEKESEKEEVKKFIKTLFQN